MKIAVISDLHLGRGDDVDHFGHDDAEFLSFLDHLEDSFERVVLLGDIYETLNGRRRGAHVSELKAARAAHPEIARRFDSERYTYIHGNHDHAAGRILGAPDEMVLEVDGKRLLFTHGHFYDVLSARARNFQEFGVWLGGWLMRLGLNPLYRLAERMDDMIRGATVTPGACKFQRWAVGLAEQRQADIIVTGHTHLGLLAEHGDRMFLNSGSCAEGKLSFLSLDTQRGDYALNTGF